MTAVTEELPIYMRWTNPEHLKTKTQLKELRLKPANLDAPDAIARVYQQSKWRNFNLYDIANCIEIKKRVIKEVEMTPENICEALYVINESAKKARDNKHFYYDIGDHEEVRLARDRQNYLYGLKDKVVIKLHQEEVLELKGYHKQTLTHEKFVRYYNHGEDAEYHEVKDYEGEERCYYDRDLKITVSYKVVVEEYQITSYLLLYANNSYSFHVPTREQPSCPLLGEIGIISVESRKSKLGINAAEKLLEKYLGQDSI